MGKRDLKRELAPFYSPSSRAVSLVDVPPMNFLTVDGAGDPNTSTTYAQAVEGLFAMSYALKFASKKGALAQDYTVMPLEGLWWADDMSSFTSGDRSAWQWTMMIMQPDFIAPPMVEEVARAVSKKHSLPALGGIRLETFCEGAAAQIMHLGPFAAEGPTIDRVHEFIEASGHQRAGKHHEIYLSDIRKAHPSKWKTVIRQPLA
ncbi:MAG: hypothetical protein HGB10_11545 [Coriobacteriia bacterium]|nr:hypothetical protein [Coriobacteriia bacterium]